MQAIWRHIWKHIMEKVKQAQPMWLYILSGKQFEKTQQRKFRHMAEKSQTNATSVTMHPLRKAIWEYIWKRKHTVHCSVDCRTCKCTPRVELHNVQKLIQLSWKFEHSYAHSHWGQAAPLNEHSAINLSEEMLHLWGSACSSTIEKKLQCKTSFRAKHTREKIYTCAECKKLFRDPRTLKRRFLTHMKTKCQPARTE